jgi:hypothetical protein
MALTVHEVTGTLVRRVSALVSDASWLLRVRRRLIRRRRGR